MKKVLALLLIFLLVLSLCGCSLHPESDNRYIVSALGFDFKENGQINLTVEALVVGTKETAATEKMTFKSSGGTPEKALKGLEAQLSKRLTLEHCGVVALGGKIVTQNYNKILSFCRNERSLNLAVFLVCTENANRLLGLKSVSTAAVGFDIMGILELNLKKNGKLHSRFYELEAQRLEGKKSIYLPFLKTENKKFFLEGGYKCAT